MDQAFQPQYFAGDFNGNTFKPDSEKKKWMIITLICWKTSIMLFAVVSFEAPFKINILFRPLHINLAANLIPCDGTDGDNGSF